MCSLDKVTHVRSGLWWDQLSKRVELQALGGGVEAREPAHFDPNFWGVFGVTPEFWDFFGVTPNSPQISGVNLGLPQNSGVYPKLF